MEEKEISLVELFALCVRCGRIAIIAAVICAVLLGAYQYYKQNEDINAKAKEVLETTSSEGVTDLVGEAKSKLDINYERELRDYQETLEKQ